MPITEITKTFRTILVLLFLGNSFYCYTQNSNERISNLYDFIEIAEKDKILVDSLNELAYLLSRSDIQNAMHFADKACSLADSLGDKSGIGDCHVRKGIILRGLGKYKEASSNYEIAREIRKDLNDFKGMANAISNIGLCHYYQEMPNLAINEYNHALRLLKSVPISESNGHIYSNIAESYSLMGNYKDALIYLDSSFKVWEIIEDYPAKARTMVSSGMINIELKDTSKARENFQNSLNEYLLIADDRGIAVANIGLGDVEFLKKNYTQATDYYNRAFLLQKALGVQDKAYLYFNQGVIAKEIGAFEEALEKFSKSKVAFEKMEDSWNLASIYNELGDIAQASNDDPLAEKQYSKCLEYCETDCDLEVQNLAYSSLGKVYTRLGNHKLAYQYSKLYNNSRDSIYSGFLLASNYQTEIQKLEKENAEFQLKISQDENKSLWYKGLIITFCLIILLGYFILRYYRSNQKRQISEFKTEQAYLEIDDILRSKELEITYAQLEAKDATQKQIGQDLHDRLGMMLSTIKLYFTDFSEQLNTLKTDTTRKQHKTIELLDEAVVEVRRISQDMQSGVLKKFGLVSAVKDLADTIEQSNRMQVMINAHGLKERIPNNFESKIYKIIQELISNVLKHSNAKNLTIYLHLQNDLFNLIVEDDGVGFDQHNVSKKGGMGLKNITYRVTELNGKCHFDSSLDKGTSVIIDIPIPKL